MDVELYLTDGRRASFMIERRLVAMHKGWKLSPSEGAGFDLIDPDKKKWEVRSITNRGVYFNPSNQVGKGRRFDENGFREKLEQLEGFILSDIGVFPRVDFYKFSKEFVQTWYRTGAIGASTKVSRTKFLRVLAPQLP